MKINQKGTITIYLIIVFLSIVILAGAAIDGARIMAAENDVENALKTAGRSVMADYDADLAGEYGIFGLETINKEQNIKENLYKYLTVNLIEKHKKLRFIKYEIDKESIEFKSLNNLSNDETIKKEIVEYMKYRAPLSITERIIDSIRASKLSAKIDFSSLEKNQRAVANELRVEILEGNETIKLINSKIDNISGQQLMSLINSLYDLEKISATLYLDNDQGKLYKYIRSEDTVNKIAKENGFEITASNEFEQISTQCANNRKIIKKYLEAAMGTYSKIKPQLMTQDKLATQLSNIKKEIKKVKEVNSEEENVRLQDLLSEKEEIENKLNEVIDAIDIEIEKLKNALQKEIFMEMKLNKDFQLIQHNDEKTDLKKYIEDNVLKYKELLAGYIDEKYLIYNLGDKCRF